MSTARLLVSEGLETARLAVAATIIRARESDYNGQATHSVVSGDRVDLLQLTAVTDAGLRLLAPFAELEELDLHDTAVSDRGLRMLAKLTALKRLDVRGTKVTEQGVANLARSLPECQMVR